MAYWGTKGSGVRVRRMALASGLAVLMCAQAQAGFGDLLNSASGLLNGGGSSTSASNLNLEGLTQAQMDAGIKQALSIGAERAVALLGKQGGFMLDPKVRIGLPKSLQPIAQGLRAAGQGQYVDQFEQAVNSAAEQAMPKTLDIVKETVSAMSLQDLRGILQGGDDAATQWLREHAGTQLEAAVEPVVAQATDSVGATAAYKKLVAQGSELTGGSLGSSLSSSLGSLGSMFGGNSGSADILDLDRYVTDKALDGLFLKLAAEEKAIREQPIARSTDLLKQVFGR